MTTNLWMLVALGLGIQGPAPESSNHNVARMPTAQTEPAIWTFSTERPPAKGSGPRFDDSIWTRGKGGFGTRGTPGALVHTERMIAGGQYIDVGLVDFLDDGKAGSAAASVSS